MEEHSLSKLKNGSPLLTMGSSLLLVGLLVFSIIETIFIMQNWKPMFHALLLSCFLFFYMLKSYYLSKHSPVYLVDFSCLEPPSQCRIPFSTFVEHTSKMEFFDQDSVAFMSKILKSSGLGEQTCLPPALHCIPPTSDHHEAVQEVHMVVFPIFEDLLSKTKLSPHDIDILIVNCSGFCPSPSLSSIIVNRYNMREDVKSFNLSGMGCSASALAVSMASDLLRVNKNSYAVVLSTEILSTGWYPGKEKPMLLLNCLFRMGSAAILLSNKHIRGRSSKYKLIRTLRNQRSFEDKAYYSSFREEDSNGMIGVTLRRDLLQAVGETIRSNITILGLSMLPFTEMIRYAVSRARKKFMDKSVEVYIPEFRSVVQHFCLPASGKGVIREIGKGWRLGEREMEPALMTLHRFGNQSSSSLWYELAYLEAKERVKKGDRVWQLGMGTGPKCTSLIWECVGAIVGEARRGPWAECINSYPIQFSDQIE